MVSRVRLSRHASAEVRFIDGEGCVLLDQEVGRSCGVPWRAAMPEDGGEGALGGDRGRSGDAPALNSIQGKERPRFGNWEEDENAGRREKGPTVVGLRNLMLIMG